MYIHYIIYNIWTAYVVKEIISFQGLNQLIGMVLSKLTDYWQVTGGYQVVLNPCIMATVAFHK